MKRFRLGEIVNRLTHGGTPPTDDPALWTGEIPWITGADILNQRVGDIRRHVNEKAVRTTSTNIVSKGDLLLVTRTGVGKMAIAPFDVAISQDFTGVTFDDQVADTNYMYFLLQAKTDDLLAFNQGTSINGITRSDLLNLEIDLPQKIEQTAIADVLSTVDRAIEQTEALIAKLRRIKAGLMHDLLTRGIDEQGNLRDPSTHEFKDSPLGLIPVEWEIKSIGEIASFVGSGITPTGGSQVYSYEGIVFIRSQNVYNDGLVLDDVAYIDESINQRMHRTRVFNRDVLLNITGASIGRCCFVPAGFPSANVNQHVCIIRRKDATVEDAIFISSYIASPFGQRQIKMLNAGGNREGLNYQQVKSILVPFPELEERKKFTCVIQEINDVIQNEVNNLAKYKRLKTGLMQDLLTGRVSVEPLIE